jgi:two-component system chemotaxis response regulator CheB
VVGLVTREQSDAGPEPAPGHDAIVIGASAGGVEAVLALAGGVPAGLPAAVFVVIHMSPTAPGFLPGLVDRAGPLPAGYAEDGAEVLPGRIYLASVDHHLLIERDGARRRRMRVWRGPKENGFRPAIDPLFRSAARAYGARAVGVILSGYLDDGTLGLMLIKRRGGVAVVMDPRPAACPDLPRSAVRNVDVDYVVPLAEMPRLFARLASEAPSPVTSQTSGVLAMTADIHSGSEDGPVETTPNPIEQKESKQGPPSGLTCPECGGALWEQRVDTVMRYSCHVGHGYTGESLEEQYVREVEVALWTAMRQLVESAELHRRLAQRMRESGPAERAADYEERAAETERRAAVIRDLLVKDRVGGLLGRRSEAGASRPTDAA